MEQASTIRGRFEPVDAQPVQHQVRPAPVNQTEIKTQKVVYAILAIISLAISYLSFFVGTAPTILLAIPTLAVGGLLIWQVIRMKDYTDPKELQKYRNEAALQPLVDTAKEHGWENMIQYGIPMQAEFNRLLGLVIQSSTFRDGKIIKGYESLNNVREKLITQGKQVELEIPHPSSYRAQFDREISGKTTVEIFERYNIEELCKYGLLPQERLDVYQNEYLPPVKALREKLSATNKEFIENFKAALDPYKTMVGQTQSKNMEQWIWLNKERTFVNRLLSSPFAEIAPDKNLDDVQEFEDLITARTTTLNLLLDIQQNRNARIEELEEEFNRVKQTINAPVQEQL